MPSKRKSYKNIIVPALELITALGIVLFWVYFFMIKNSDPKNTAVYLAFERAFPVADICWLAPALIIGAIGLVKKKAYGMIFTLAGGGAMIFLGLLDISFNIFHGIYSRSLFDGALNGFINLWSIFFGITLIFYAWRKKRTV